MCEHRYLNNTCTVFYMNNVWTQESQQHTHCVLHEQCVNTGISTTHALCSTWTMCEHRYLNNTCTVFYMNNVWTQVSQQHTHCVLHEQCVNTGISTTHALCSTWTMCEHEYLNNTFTVFYMNNVWTQESQQHIHCFLHEQCVNTGISTTHALCSTWTMCEHRYLNNTRTVFYMNNVWTWVSQQHIHCVLHEQCVNTGISTTHAQCSTWTTCEHEYLNNTFTVFYMNNVWTQESQQHMHCVLHEQCVNMSILTHALCSTWTMCEHRNLNNTCTVFYMNNVWTWVSQQHTHWVLHEQCVNTGISTTHSLCSTWTMCEHRYLNNTRTVFYMNNVWTWVSQQHIHCVLHEQCVNTGISTTHSLCSTWTMCEHRYLNNTRTVFYMNNVWTWVSQQHIHCVLHEQCVNTGISTTHALSSTWTMCEHRNLNNTCTVFYMNNVWTQVSQQHTHSVLHEQRVNMSILTTHALSSTWTMCEHRNLNNTCTEFYMNNVWTQESQQHMHSVLHEQCVNTGISTTHTQCSTWTTCEHEYLNNTRTEFHMNNVWTQESQQHIHCVLHEQCVNMSILTHALCSTWTTCELKYLNNTFPQLTQCVCQCILNTAWKKEKKQKWNT